MNYKGVYRTAPASTGLLILIAVDEFIPSFTWEKFSLSKSLLRYALALTMMLVTKSQDSIHQTGAC